MESENTGDGASSSEQKPTGETFYYKKATLYLCTEMFGIRRLNCKELRIQTGQKYAQYNDAVKVEFLESGKRTWRATMLSGKPWLRVVSTGVAIDPDAAMVPNGEGSSTSRYASCDPRYMTDFEDKLAGAGITVLLSIGAGDREGEFPERCKNNDGK